MVDIQNISKFLRMTEPGGPQTGSEFLTILSDQVPGLLGCVGLPLPVSFNFNKCL